MKGKETNVGIVERFIRVAGGGALAVVALILLVGGASLWLAILYIAGIGLGLDFVYTGLTGYCPLYGKLGWRTNRQQPRGPQLKGSN